MSDTSYMVYDYPDPPEYDEILCDECNLEMGATAFSVEGRWICSNCFRDYIDNYYGPEELADELGFDYRHVEDMT